MVQCKTRLRELSSIDALMSYKWPGNLRELENQIERSLILHRGELLRFENLVSLPSKQVDANTGWTEDVTLELYALVRKHIQRALEKTSGKVHAPRGEQVNF